MLDKYSHCFFDIDGVLLDTVDYISSLFCFMAKVLEVKNCPDITYFKKNYNVKVYDLLSPLVSKSKHTEIDPLFLKENKEFHDPSVFPEFEGATELLKLLSSSKKNIALISSKLRIGVDLVLDYFSWDKYVSFSVAGDEVVNLKPDPEGIFQALDYYQAEPQDAVYVGDTISDFRAAKNAGVNFLGVLTGPVSIMEWNTLGTKYVKSVKEIIYN